MYLLISETARPTWIVESNALPTSRLLALNVRTTLYWSSNICDHLHPTRANAYLHIFMRQRTGFLCSGRTTQKKKVQFFRAKNEIKRLIIALDFYGAKRLHFSWMIIRIFIVERKARVLFWNFKKMQRGSRVETRFNVPFWWNYVL